MSLAAEGDDPHPPASPLTPAASERPPVSQRQAEVGRSTIEVLDETASGLDVGGLDVAQLADLAAFAFHRMHLHPATELSIAAVDPDRMADLHVEWMDEPGPTDVLSFPMDEITPGSATELGGPGLLGDIVLCPDVAVRQATEAGHSPAHESAILLVHGVLHLLGYDHAEPDEKNRMFALQSQIVSDWESR